MFGTTSSGGANEKGMVWEILPSGAYRDLHDFGGTVRDADGSRGPDGTVPTAGVTFDAGGNMLGTAFSGGANDRGIVWQIDPLGNYWDLHDFGGTVTNVNGAKGPDGGSPVSGLTLDQLGNVYGTARIGGPNRTKNLVGGGMVWEITANGVYRDLHDFGGVTINTDGKKGPDGVDPRAGVAVDPAGDLFGTTYNGGAHPGPLAVGDGIVWEITAGGAYKDIHDFGGKVMTSTGTEGTDGISPWACVTLDGNGTLFGTARNGGAFGTDGMIWEITSAGAYVDLHDFGNMVCCAGGGIVCDGTLPSSGVTIDTRGNIFGTASFGGPNPGADDLLPPIRPPTNSQVAFQYRPCRRPIKTRPSPIPRKVHP
jgi:hypothetical protein